MPYLICYDIENDRLRNKTAGRLEYYGLLRLQKSVFIGEIKEGHFARLETWLGKNILPALQPHDQIAILLLGKEDMLATKHLKAIPGGWDDLLNPPTTLIL